MALLYLISLLLDVCKLGNVNSDRLVVPITNVTRKLNHYFSEILSQSLLPVRSIFCGFVKNVSSNLEPNWKKKLYWPQSSLSGLTSFFFKLFYLFWSMDTAIGKTSGRSFHCVHMQHDILNQIHTTVVYISSKQYPYDIHKKAP